MLKSFLSTTTILFLSGMSLVSAQQKPNGKGPKFLEDIIVEVAPSSTAAEAPSKIKKTDASFAVKRETISPATTAAIENADKLQFKYSLLLDTEVEAIQNLWLVKQVDEWMGTRYRLGGSTKMGIDCSALMQVLFASVYGIALPRTSKEQFNISTKVSREDIKEGDLIFFNTTGGVSHVGFYIQNNKFVHASTTGGVTISDLDEEYWSRKFLCVRRIEETSTASSSKP
jgi:hypothetical protein